MSSTRRSKFGNQGVLFVDAVAETEGRYTQFPLSHVCTMVEVLIAQDQFSYHTCPFGSIVINVSQSKTCGIIFMCFFPPMLNIYIVAQSLPAI